MNQSDSSVVNDTADMAQKDASSQTPRHWNTEAFINSASNIPLPSEPQGKYTLQFS